MGADDLVGFSRGGDVALGDFAGELGVELVGLVPLVATTAGELLLLDASELETDVVLGTLLVFG